MVGQGRSFRRHTAMFWEYWALPPKVEMPSKVIYVDGIYLARKACILIACNDTYVLGWYLCRYENARAWEARSEEHTSELQSRQYLVCRLLLEKKKQDLT